MSEPLSHPSSPHDPLVPEGGTVITPLDSFSLYLLHPSPSSPVNNLSCQGLLPMKSQREKTSASFDVFGQANGLGPVLRSYGELGQFYPGLPYEEVEVGRAAW